jgi:hypothetical protein
VRATSYLAPLVAAGCLLSACAGRGTYTARSPQVRVTVSGGCPRQGHWADVANPGGGLTGRLAYPGARSGLACVYAAGNERLTLLRTVVVDAGGAGRISDAAARVRLGVPSGNVNCAAGRPRTVVLALGYARHPDVDIWYDLTGGCVLADNGSVEATDTANSTFAAFADALYALTGA